MDQDLTDPRTLTIGGTKDSRTSLKVVNHEFVIGKEEFYPFIAEMHYYRIPKRYWSVCFERIRKAEFRIISTSVPWNLHEARQGDFDFSGASDQAKDLVVFLELCREFGFKIMLRPGPWIGAQWSRGGIPDFATRHPETACKDPEGQILTADPGADAKKGVIPSYLSPRFQILLKNYFSVFAEVVRNYIYPRGPVFMIEIDHETSFGGNFNPFSCDYNPLGSLSAYPKFLEEKYSTIDQVNKAYKIKAKDFAEVAPPTSWDGKSMNDFLKACDWVEFREWVVNRYAETIAELVSQTEISALFTRSLAFDGPYYFPDVAGARTGGRVVFTTNLGWDIPFADTVRHAHAVAGWQATGLCSNLSLGHPHSNPEVGHIAHPITAGDSKRLLIAAMAGGMKGFNYHMFVGHDSWYDAALQGDGAILPSYEIVRDANAQFQRIHYETMKDFAQVALVQYRPYLRAVNLPAVGSFAYLHDLAGNDFSDLATDMGALGCDYRIFDLTVGSRLGEYNTIVLPVGEFMDAGAQSRLLSLAQGGAHLILYGLLPKMDTNLDPCEVLAKGIGIRTMPKEGIYAVEAQKQQFNVSALGTVTRAPGTAAKVAKSGAKLLGVSVKCGKGHVTVITFAPGSRLLHSKLAFVQDILKIGKLQSPVSSSDPGVHVAVQAHAKGALLMVYDLEEAGKSQEAIPATNVTRRVILSLDLKAIGMAAKTVALTDILGTETIKVQAKDLASGIELRLLRGDSRLYYIEKKS
jgi:beta-galactosidase